MKFNWKANWEILLVLVIIVIGIAITTIAAIRNKDKQSLSDDTDYGQYAGANGGLTSDTSSDMQSGQIGSVNTDSDPSTRRPLSSKSARQTTPASSPATPTIKANGQYGGQFEGRQSKLEENGVGVTAENHQVTTVSSISGDLYDGSSTEPTPSQVSQIGATNAQSPRTVGGGNPQQGARQFGAFGANKNRRPVTAKHEASEDVTSTVGVDPMGESMDPNDDIHTTRSSLASGLVISGERQGGASNLFANNPHGTIPGPQGDQTNMVTPSLTLQAPYGSTPQALNQFGHLLAHSTPAKKQLDPNGALLDSDEFLSSYARLQTNDSSNWNEALIREYNLANSFNVSNPNLLHGLVSQNQDSDSSNVFGQTTNSVPVNGPAGSHRTYPASLPISVLLSDLIRLARPHQRGEQQQQQQAATNRPQTGVLQQLRALPMPLLALLHGATNGNVGATQPTGAHDLAGSVSHDTSESSQHYHRISVAPTDLHSIIARSLKTTGILPAFPAPKGTISSWIPPTVGGNYNPAMNNNADFVASNAAGFLRANQQHQQHSQQSSQPDPAYQQQAQSNSEQNYQRQSTETPYSHALQSSEGGQQQQVQTNLVNKGPFQQANSFENHNQQQQLQQKQDSYGSTNNQMVGYQANNAIQMNSNQPQQQQQQQHQLAAQMSLMSKPNSLPQGSFVQSQAYQNQNRQPQSSEIQVPLGYNPAPSQQHNLVAQMGFGVGQPVGRNPFDYNPAQVESAPRITVMNANGKSPVALPMNNQQSTPMKQTQQPIAQVSQLQQQQKTHARRKRSTIGISNKRKIHDSDSVEDEDHLDSHPISVVYPDGRPMSKVKLRGFQAVQDSMIEDGEQHKDEGGLMGDGLVSSRSKKSAKKFKGSSRQLHDDQALMYHDNEKENLLSRKYSNKPKLSMVLSSHPDTRQRKVKTMTGKLDSKGATLDTAGSGLMSKLLGTASTNDDEIEDMDDDDENSANEKRREEMDDAEFGISNDDRPGKMNSASDNNQDGGSGSPDSRSHAAGEGDRDSNLGSGSTDNEAHTTRRNQQRSDIEFYGHPGEETRQLKYGILGSGNYEVINGGVYAEGDESTAAVNSVANYARKPSLLMGGFSKLMAAGGREQSMVHQADAFMPGERVGGFLRGASAHPDESIGLLPLHPGGPGKTGVMPNPILELIDPNGQLFDPNLLAQLGSSGTSAQTTHASKEDDLGGDDDGSSVGGDSKEDVGPRKQQQAYDREKQMNGRKLHLKKYQKDSTRKLKSNGNQQDVLESHYGDSGRALSASVDDETGDDEPSSSKKLIRSSSKVKDPKSHQGSNQFNSYQISPSKKVTIFSDQDLDSAPSESNLIRIDNSSVGMFGRRLPASRSTLVT